MARHSTHEMDEDMLHPSGYGEPTRGLPSVKCLYAAVYPRTPFGELRDQDDNGSGGPCPRDNPQLQVPTQGSGEMERKKDLGHHSFPRKLWEIVQDATFTSVRWSDNGDSVIIDQDLLQMEVLCGKGSQTGTSWLSELHFKICGVPGSLSQKVSRPLLYGFKKIHPSDASGYLSENNRILIYHNSNFQKDKPWLMENVTRQDNQMTPIGTATPDATEAANQKAQESSPDDQGSSAMGSFQLTGPGVPQPCHGSPCPN
ncbi:heat shock transcription factor, X-linked member 3-like [Saccopteryx leptura]|uniref:heat shock transcription factor, X-linked member 3-like n=1 Tax=Saccopteryx leptura TaxID=249018 RepID=UPI00339BD26D